MITQQQFGRLFPACPKAKAYLPLLVAAMLEFGITTRKRAAAFCAQLGHESLDFKYMQEIASGAAYEGRRDLGNTQPGDGRRFKGRGPIQTTGRNNYRKAGAALKLPLLDRPELLAEPRHGFRASAYFWQSNGLNKLADALRGTGDARDLTLFDKTTRRVNGGYNGKVDRQGNYINALSILTDAQFADAQLQHTLDTLTEPAASPAAPTPAAPPSAAPQAPAPAEAPAEPSLLEEIPVNDTTRNMGRAAAVNVGKRAGGVLAYVGALLQAGDVKTWLFVIVAVVGLGLLIYFERKALRGVVRSAARLVGRFIS